MVEKIRKIRREYANAATTAVSKISQNSLMEYDVECPAILFRENHLLFDFQDDEYENFKIPIESIKDIVFEDLFGMSISTLNLFDGSSILIHNLGN